MNGNEDGNADGIICVWYTLWEVEGQGLLTCQRASPVVSSLRNQLQYVPEYGGVVEK
jgi:hypothetical protein